MIDKRGSRGSVLFAARTLVFSLPAVLFLLGSAGSNPPSGPTSGSDAPPGTSAYLTTRLDRLLEAPSARSAFWGVYVLDVSTREVLYDHDGDKRFMPASNQKLFTTTTALDVLRSDFRYQTVLYFRGEVSGDTLVGDLILRGSGDPTFGSARYRTDPLQEWARELKRLGVKSVRGRIIGDDNVFDDKPYADGWDVGLIATQSYAPSSSGLSYRDNLIDVLVRGRQDGSAPLVTESPAPHFLIENTAVTGGRGASLAIDRLPGSITLRLGGGIGAGVSRRLRLPVGNPTLYAVSCFDVYLRAAGIQVDARPMDGDDVPGGLSYRGAQPLLTYVSPPLRQLIGLINKNSNNFYAEQVFRTFAPRGSARAGDTKVKELLRKAGVRGESLSIRDGSGLSRKDLVTPRSVAELLAYMYHHPEWDAFTKSLPRGGERGTTLARRLSDVPVQAKTGTLEYARALSGYVVTRNNSVLAFSVLANNFSGSGGNISGTVDAIVRTLAAYRGE